MSHVMPALTCEAVEEALALLGYGEPDLDGALAEDEGHRLSQLLTVVLAVTEAHLRERDATLDNLYMSVSDHLAEEDCSCELSAGAALASVPRPRHASGSDVAAAHGASTS